jgi:uncharacterized caspase-like protein
MAGQGEAVEAAARAEQVEADRAVRIGFEDELARVAALGDVVWGIGSGHACKTGHDEGECGKRADTLKGNVSSRPRFLPLSGGKPFGFVCERFLTLRR